MTPDETPASVIHRIRYNRLRMDAMFADIDELRSINEGLERSLAPLVPEGGKRRFNHRFDYVDYAVEICHAEGQVIRINLEALPSLYDLTWPETPAVAEAVTDSPSSGESGSQSFVMEFGQTIDPPVDVKAGPFDQAYVFGHHGRHMVNEHGYDEHGRLWADLTPASFTTDHITCGTAS